MTQKQEDNLRLTSEFIGWGVPQNALWFVGLEEGATFDEAYIADLRGRRSAFRRAGVFDGDAFWDPPRAPEEPFLTPSRTDRGEGALCAAVCLEPVSVEDFVRTRLWKSQTFHCNLYCLGYQRSGSGYPSPDYAALFGVEGLADERLVAAVAARHAAIRRLAARCVPQAIVCLGLGHKEEFEKALGLEGGQGRPMGSTRAIVYPKSKAMIVHHASRPSFRSSIPDLAVLLRGWGVEL